jgi:hypothetical protein
MTADRPSAQGSLVERGDERGLSLVLDPQVIKVNGEPRWVTGPTAGVLQPPDQLYRPGVAVLVAGIAELTFDQILVRADHIGRMTPGWAPRYAFLWM